MKLLKLPTKICTNCKQEKTVTEFGVDKHLKSGRMSACLECVRPLKREYQRKYRPHYQEKNKEKLRVYHATYSKTYRLEHKEQLDASYTRWLTSIEGKRTRKNSTLLCTHGITLEAYEALLQKQNGVCAICAEPETRKHQNGNVRALSVDHDHTCCTEDKSCGQCIRGLLCSDCNFAIGLLKDSPIIAMSLVAYLRGSTVK